MKYRILWPEISNWEDSLEAALSTVSPDFIGVAQIESSEPRIFGQFINFDKIPKVFV